MTLRRRAITADPADLRAHDHTAWCGDGQAELHRVAAAAFSTAATRGERMMLIGDEPRLDGLAGLGDSEGLYERGALQLLRLDDVYAHPASAQEQQEQFEAALAQAFADGYTGLSVVADNSAFAAGSEQSYERWLAWEATADRLQAASPISGLCYFDRRQVSVDRLADLAALHPVRGRTVADPAFQVFCDRDGLRAFGELDAAGAERIRRVIGSVSFIGDFVLDISQVDFIDCGALRALDDIAQARPPLRLAGAKPIVHRAWDLLDLPSPALEFC